MKIIGKIVSEKVTYRGFCVCKSILDANREELEEDGDGELFGTCSKCDERCLFEQKVDRIIQ